MPLQRMTPNQIVPTDFGAITKWANLRDVEILRFERMAVHYPIGAHAIFNGLNMRDLVSAAIQSL